MQPKTPRLFEVTVTQIEMTKRKAYVMAISAEDALQLHPGEDISMMQDDDTSCELSISDPKEISKLADVVPGWRDAEAHASVGFSKYVEANAGKGQHWWKRMHIGDHFDELRKLSKARKR